MKIIFISSLLTVFSFMGFYGLENSLNSVKTQKDDNLVLGKDTLFTFDNYESGHINHNWENKLTGKGKMCNWVLHNDNGNMVLAQTSNEKQDYRFNIVINNKLIYKDLQINLRFKGVEGKYDQGGGAVWRYQDENNYYVARANPLENNFRLYKVVDGNRKELKSADVDIETGKWYDLSFSMQKNEIRCFFNGKLVMEKADNTFEDAGKVGLWTKSDAVTYFDDLGITSNSPP